MKTMINRLFLLLTLAGHCALAQKTPEPGYETGMKLRSNVVQLSGKIPGFGLIVAVQKDVAFIVTSREIVRYGVQQITFADGTKGEGQELKIKSEDNGLGLLRVKVPSSMGSKIILPCTSQTVFADTRTWVIGAMGELMVPSGSKAGVVLEVTPTTIIFDMPVAAYGSAGAPILNESGITGIITRTDGDHITAIRMQTVRATVANANYPFELQPFQTASSNPGDKCVIQLDYKGSGTGLEGTEVPLQLYIKSLRINNENVPHPASRSYPISLQYGPCGKVVYEIEAELTNGSQVWKGRGRGEVQAIGGDMLFINWKQTSRDLMEISLVQSKP